MVGLKKRLTSLFVVIIFLLALMPQGQVFASEDISGNVTWSTNQTLTQDVVVQSGGHLTIQSGVTVTAPCTDPNAEGRDTARIEILVEAGGQLTVDGATFEGDGSAGCWGGIYIESGDDLSVIQNSLIRDASLGIKIVDSSPDILNNEITNLKGTNGSTPGADGGDTYGIFIEVDSGSAAPLIQGNHLHHLTGGDGAAGLDGADGSSPGADGEDGEDGGGGGSVYGIQSEEGADPDIIGNTIEYLTSGSAGKGGDGGDGAAGADGASPGAAGQYGGDGGNGASCNRVGDVYGINTYNNLDTMILDNTIAYLTQTTACIGGAGGAGGAGGRGANGDEDGPGGAGGNGGKGGYGGSGEDSLFVIGIQVNYSSSSTTSNPIFKGNLVHDLMGGDGSDGGHGGVGGAGGVGGKGGPYGTTAAGRGGDGGWGGAGGSAGFGLSGGSARGIQIINIEMTIEANSVYHIDPGDGGQPGVSGNGGKGGDGGDGGDHSGGLAGDGGDGGWGGLGAYGGTSKSYDFGKGIIVGGSSDQNITIINNDVWDVEGSQANDGTNGGTGGDGGDGGDMGAGSGGRAGDGGNGGWGGDGGYGSLPGDAYLLQTSDIGGAVINNTLMNASAQETGGLGGSGGSAGAGGSAGSGDLPGSNGAKGFVGMDGVDRDGMRGYGIYNSGNLVIYNNIVISTLGASNSIGIAEQFYDEIDQMDYNNVYGWHGLYSVSIPIGDHAISADPRFVSATDHRLRSSSPCVDAGDNSVAPAEDLNGDARPQDGDGDGTATANMGAYEVPFDPPPDDLYFYLPFVIR